MIIFPPHGAIELVKSTPDADNVVVDAARVSTSSKRNPERDAKLIRYLASHRHMSPFEHVHFTFKVRAPMFVARQWMRYRTGSFNEQSARYGEMSDDFYDPPLERMMLAGQAKKNLQASGEPIEPGVARGAIAIMRGAYREAYKAYEALLDLGVARELARAVLPVSLYTQFYWTVNLRNVVHFIQERDDSHAQWEIQQYAKAVRELVVEAAPVSARALLG